MRATGRLRSARPIEEERWRAQPPTRASKPKGLDGEHPRRGVSDHRRGQPRPAGDPHEGRRVHLHLGRVRREGGARWRAASPRWASSRGQTIGLMLTNRPEFHFVDSAALHLGRHAVLDLQHLHGRADRVPGGRRRQQDPRDREGLPGHRSSKVEGHRDRGRGRRRRLRRHAHARRRRGQGRRGLRLRGAPGRPSSPTTSSRSSTPPAPPGRPRACSSPTTTWCPRCRPSTR